MATAFEIYQQSYHDLGYSYGYQISKLFDAGGDLTSILSLVRAILALNKSRAEFIAGLFFSAGLGEALPPSILKKDERKLTKGELLLQLTQIDPEQMGDLEKVNDYYARYESRF